MKNKGLISDKLKQKIYLHVQKQNKEANKQQTTKQ
jgi:hypothetical protein